MSPNWADDDRLVYALRYCAPELLEGGVVDQRADVFALGALLFELVAGRPAFGGQHARGVAAQIDASPPSLTDVPPAVGPLLARALEARVGARLRSVGELRTQALALVGDRAAAARKLLAERARPRLPSDVPRTSPLDVALPAEATARGDGDSRAVDRRRLLPDARQRRRAERRYRRRRRCCRRRSSGAAVRCIPPAAATVWDPPSTTATTTLDALRRKRPRHWLRAVVPLALDRHGVRDGVRVAARRAHARAHRGRRARSARAPRRRHRRRR